MSQSQDSDSLPAPDWQYWSSREEWQILDGAILLVDVEPRSKPGQRIKAALSLRDIADASEPVKQARLAPTEYNARLSDSEAPPFMRALDIYTNAWAAVRRRKLASHIVPPGEFLRWAFDRNYVIPPSVEIAKDRQTEADLSERWGTRQLWTLMETAHLFCNLEPLQDARAETLRAAVAEWYRDLKDAVVTLQQITHYAPRSGMMPDALLRPHDAVTWAIDNKRAIPRWLAALAPPQPTRAQLLARILELESLPAQLPAQVVSENIEVGERKTLDTLAAYFAKKHAYDPDAPKSDAPGKVRLQLESVGLQLSEKTIRKIMAAGLKRFPPDRNS